MSEKPTLITVDPTGLSTLQRETYLNERPLIRHLTKFVTYLGIGALVHAWFLGPDFDSRSLWSWGYLLAWPIPMLAWLVLQIAVVGLWVLAAAAVFALAFGSTKLILKGLTAQRERKFNQAMDRFTRNRGRRQ